MLARATITPRSPASAQCASTESPSPGRRVTRRPSSACSSMVSTTMPAPEPRRERRRRRRRRARSRSAARCRAGARRARRRAHRPSAAAATGPAPRRRRRRPCVRHGRRGAAICAVVEALTADDGVDLRAERGGEPRRLLEQAERARADRAVVLLAEDEDVAHQMAFRSSRNARISSAELPLSSSMRLPPSLAGGGVSVEHLGRRCRPRRRDRRARAGSAASCARP